MNSTLPTVTPNAEKNAKICALVLDKRKNSVSSWLCVLDTVILPRWWYLNVNKGNKTKEFIDRFIRSSFFTRVILMLLKSKSCSNESPLLVDTFIANKQQIWQTCWWRPLKKKLVLGILLEKTFTEQRLQNYLIISVTKKSLKPDPVTVENFCFRSKNDKHNWGMQII